MIEFNNRECKERQIRNENNRKDYSDFQKEIALQRDKLTIYHMNELNMAVDCFTALLNMNLYITGK